MPKKPIKTTLLLTVLLLLANTMSAQVDYLETARQFLAEGNCEGAQTYYELYRDLHSADRDMEVAIAVCQAQREQLERYNQMVAFYENQLQALQVKDSVQYASMKAVYESLLAGNCDMAYQEYLNWHAVSGYEDTALETRITQCKQQKAEKEKPKATEDVKEVGNLEYYIYLPGTLMAWKSANDAAMVSRGGGNAEWRFPTVAELQIVLQQMDDKSYKFVDASHWSSDMTLYRDGSGYCSFVHDRTRVGTYDVNNKTPTGLCYCILVRTKR